MNRSPRILLGGLFLVAAIGAAALIHKVIASPESQMLAAARKFISTLNPEQSQAARFGFDSDQRLNWQFRKGERKGLPLKDMDAAQRAAAMELLKTGVSAKGIEKATIIRESEFLQEKSERGPPSDPDRYFFSVFGEPSESGSWAWRYEGHHCALNFTIVAGKAVATSPQFWGNYPAEVRETVPGAPPKGTRPFAAEDDLGLKLVNALSDAQRTEAIVNATSPTNIVTGAAREAAIQEDTGIAWDKLTPDQRKILSDVIRTYTDNMTKQLADIRMAKLEKAGLNKIKFAWMGGTKAGVGHYYRVQGPTFLLEFDNTQNDANHIHSCWRDFKGDFGRDLLAEHYERFQHVAHDHDHGHDHDHDHDHHDTR